MSLGYALCDMVVFALFSRLLTKEDFGYYAVVCAVLVIVQSLSDAGIGASVIQKKEPSQEYIHTAFTLSFIVGFVSFLLVLVFSHPIALLLAGEEIARPIAIASVLALLYSVNSVAGALLLKELHFMKLGLLKIAAYIVGGVVGLVMAAHGAGVYSLVTFLIIQWSLQTLFVFAVTGYHPRFLLRKKDVKGQIFFSGWLTLGIIVKNLAWQFDKLVLSRWLSVASLGAYNRPSGFIGSFSNQTLGIMDTTIFPILSGIQDQKDKMRRAFARAIKLTNNFSILFSLFFFFNAELIINVFFGDQWLHLVPVMRVVSLFLVFNVGNRLCDCFLRSMGLVRQFFYIRVISFVITVVFLFIGVKADILGVAFAMLSVTATTCLIKLVYVGRKLAISFSRLALQIGRSWASSLPMLLMGIPFALFVEKSWLNCSLFALLSIGVTLLLFLRYPSFVGKEYKETLFPRMERFFKRSSSPQA